MKIRMSLAAAALSLGFVASPSIAADAVKKPAYGFSTLKAADATAAKAKSEAWLKTTGKFEQAAFDKAWSDETRSVLDRVADTIALGNTEAAAILEAARKTDAPAHAEVPPMLKDAKGDAFVRSNLALVFAKANAGKKAYEEALEALSAITPENVVDPVVPS